jgi:filamentous hemagglutinin
MKKQNSKTTPLCHRACALLLAASLTLSPALAAAATPTIPGFYGNVPMPAAPVAGTLPLLLANGTKLGITGATRSGNTLTVDQNAPQAIIDWASFNIAPDSVVIFKQQLNGVNQTSWAALNRIFSASPSLIFGSIQAPGKIYLINQNGILFGKGSRVDTHSLVASALNITNDDFLNGRLRFTTTPFGNQGALTKDSTVSNYGSITTDNGGSVFLVGPRVENAGTISSPGGKINLVGVGSRADGSVPVNGEVEILEQTANDTDVDVTYSDRQVPGAAFNLAGGSLLVDTGRIGMFGATVQNDGLIRAVTALKKGGVVYLAARDSISTGAQSVIETPVPASSDTAHPKFIYAPGNVTLTGVTTTAGLTPVDNIEHLGVISAPSGNVTLNATKGVLLGEGSSISVAGLWLDRSVSDNLMEAQLNSVELRDEYAQKDGVLKGKTIKVDVLSGSNIGNLDGHYLGIDSGAQQRSTGGGNINISSSTDPLAQLLVMDGALLDFSGGGVRYGAGMLATSKLASGGKVYDISTAPKNITYDALLDSQKRTNTRFGVVQNYSGLYFGGATSVGDYSAGRTVGAAAGKADLEARVIVLDGTLKATATAGLYQTKVTPSGSDGADAFNVSVARGLERPAGGALQLGRSINESPSGGIFGEDAVLGDAVIAATTTKYVAGDPLPSGTRISADTLNNAGLGSLSIFANSTVTFGEGSRLALQPGASLTARAGRIEQQGEIVIPGGSVTLGIRDTIAAWEFLPDNLAVKNPLYQPVISSINLAAGSVISVAGQKVDNSAAGGGSIKAASSDGGSIQLVDASFQSNAIFTGQPTDAYGKPSQGHIINLAYGALLDVSGGYLIDSTGKIAGGNAGSLTMKAPTLSLAGEVKGLSLAGKTGGSITLHAGEVVVTKHDVTMPDNLGMDSPIPGYLLGKLVISDTRLQDTGFTRISLIAINDLTVTDGALLAPSTRKMEAPVPAIVSQRGALVNSVVPVGNDPSVVDYLGGTSISLAAGQNIYTRELPPLNGTAPTNLPNLSARVTVSAGSGVNPTPGGSITVKAPVVELSGTLEALGGTISVTASGSSSGDLTVHDGGRILAGGYNKPDSSLVAGLPAGPVPKAGGTVKLSSDHDIVLESGAVIDVSGSTPVQRLVTGADGVPVSQTVAGNPGSLTLSFGNRLVLDGEISGRSTLTGQQGGSLTLVSKLDQSLRQADLDRYLASGFDALSFVSTNTGGVGSGSILIKENLDLHDARSLTLDAMSITGSGDAQATLQAKWVRLVNSNLTLNPTVATNDSGTGALSVKAGYLDVEGNLLLTGFNQVTLLADHDLRFADRTYTLNNIWSGNLQVTGNLTLQASRIYPTTATQFAVSTPGKVTILPGNLDSNPVYSAGGSLTITAQGGIEVRGTLLAPQGNITLDAGSAGQLLLTSESRIITGGSVPVAYGTYDGSTWMTHAVASNGTVTTTGVEVTKPPTGSVSLNGHEVLVSQGATIDVSGGGSVYASLFQPSIAGSSNPLAASSGRYVILPDRSVTLPGAAVYLDAVPSLGLAAGVYSLLPADKYANVPGALIVQDTGQQVAAGQKGVTSQGYQVTAGYATVTDTQIASQARQGYSVRSAADVLKEGDFSAAKSFVTGNGGDVTLTANSAVFSGSLIAQPLAGYQGGTLSLSAKNVVAQNGAAELPAGFSFGDQLPASLTDTLVLDGATVSGKGFANLWLGKTFDTKNNQYVYQTDTVTVKNGSTLQASSVTLHGNTGVTIETGTAVEAIADSSSATAANRGVLSVEVPKGTFDLQTGSLVHASNALSFDAESMLLLGAFQADLGKLSLASNNLIFAEGAKPSAVKGLYLDDTLVQTLSKGFKDLKLISRGSIDFQEKVALTTKSALTLDAGSYTSADGLTVSFSTDGKLTLLNSGASGTPQGNANSSSISFFGAGIDVSLSGHNIVLDQFKTVTLDSSQDVTLRGVGTFGVAQDLTIKAPRVTTSAYQHTGDPTNPADVSVAYTAADFTVDAERGKVSIEGNSGSASGDRTPGGSLTIKGKSISMAASVTLNEANEQVFHPTVLDIPSGRLQLTATGDITLGDKTSILATGTSEAAQSGTVYYPGGSIALTSNSGAVTLASGSLIDVSASTQGDAGSVSLSAATGGVSAASGTLKGRKADSGSGVGGSLSIDSHTLDLNGFATTLNADGTLKEDGTLKVGGFDNRVSLRSRSGDLALSSDKIISGREVVVAADGGSLTISGTVSANGSKEAGQAGGTVELYAEKALTLENGSRVSAKGGSGADGGSVSLSTLATDKIAGAYALTVASGAKIDVSGDAQGKGGNVALRAYQIGANYDDVNLADLPTGTIVGATRVSVEAARTYLKTGDIVSADLSSYQAESTKFLADFGAGGRSLFGSAPTGPEYLLQAGIEIDSNASLTLATDWNLSSFRPGGQAGVLTLHSQGDLTLNKSIFDAPTARETLYSSTMQPSWAINLVAGADSGANYKAVKTDIGNLTVADQVVVYTENAPIYFAAGNDATFSGSSASPVPKTGVGAGPGYMINTIMKYNLGSYGGSVTGVVGRDLNLAKVGSVIQTALGDIDLRVGRDLNLATVNSLGATTSAGAIRTTGEYDNSFTQAKQNLEVSLNSDIGNRNGPQLYQDADLQSYWLYHNGGDIRLDVGHAVTGASTSASSSYGWDAAYIGDTIPKTYVFGQVPKYLSASFGDVIYPKVDDKPTVSDTSTIGIATLGGGNIAVRTGGSFLSPIGAFGTLNQGNVSILSGGDVTGRFRVMKGDLSILGGGSFGTKNTPQVVEMAAASVSLAVQGDVHLGEVFDPDNVRKGLFPDSVASGQYSWNLTYNRNSSISIVSLAGDLTLYGSTGALPSNYVDSTVPDRVRILPSTVVLEAAGNLNLLNNFDLAPSASGNLTLFAGGDIAGLVTVTSGQKSNSGSFIMADVSPDNIYGWQQTNGAINPDTAIADPQKHYQTVHQGDTAASKPVKVSAKGNITDLYLVVNKAADISAGKSIERLDLVAQHTAAGQLTRVSAGTSIDLGVASVIETSNAKEDFSKYFPGIVVGGPGDLVVSAGQRIDLGNSRGIQAVGNDNNAALSGDANVTVVVGARKDLSASAAAAFFYGEDNSTDHADQALNGLQKAGDQYAALKAAGHDQEAKDRLEKARSQIIRPYFDPFDKDTQLASGLGSLNMTRSEIKSVTGNIRVLTQGDLNLGVTALSSKTTETTGITTRAGGQIAVYSGGSINVNESRVMTFQGGDITLYSDLGDINAGRGSKTTVSPPTRDVIVDPITHKVTFSPWRTPSVGSGVRALTYDPDGPTGPLEAPPAGNVHIFAPNGTIDAGEAGIFGGTITLGAIRVASADNIFSLGTSVGVPSGDSAVNLGALAGNSSLSDSAKLVEDSQTLGAVREKTAQQAAKVDDFLSRWLDLRIISFDEPEEGGAAPDKEQEKQDQKKGR